MSGNQEQLGVLGVPGGEGRVGVLGALADEVLPAVSRLKLVRRGEDYVGQVAGKKVVALVSGVGAKRIEAAMQRLVKEHQVGQVVLIGFAGGLDPGLAGGAVVDVSWVIDGQGGAAKLSGGVDRIGSVPRMVEDELGRGVEGCLLTRDRMVDSVAGKRELFERYRAAVVDMESFYGAKVASRLGVGLRVLRAVSDPWDQSLPGAAVDWVGADGSAKVWPAVGYLVAHPWAIAGMLRVRGYARLGAQRLAQRVEVLLTA